MAILRSNTRLALMVFSNCFEYFVVLDELHGVGLIEIVSFKYFHIIWGHMTNLHLERLDRESAYDLPCSSCRAYTSGKHNTSKSALSGSNRNATFLRNFYNVCKGCSCAQMFSCTYYICAVSQLNGTAYDD